MKKIVSFILAIALMLSTVPAYAAEAHWEQSGANWRYVDESGNYVVSDWVVITKTNADQSVETKYYYMNEEGIMVVGWKQIDGYYYYFDQSGARCTGWLEDKAVGKWYYLHEDGKMATGWVQVGEHTYYMAGNGEMLTGWQKIDGVWRYFNDKGYWIDDNSAIQNSIPGIDVSYYQKDIDWDAVKNEGIQFTFIRIGHGERKLDTKFVRNITEANRVGIPAGVYFYSTAQTVEQAILDAQFVIDNIQGYTISYPVVIDMEDKSQVNLGKQAITDMVIAFCNEIRAAGYTPMIYCNENWYKNYIDFNQLGNLDRWIARYSVKGSDSIARNIWQAGSSTILSGIEGRVDIDFAYTDYSQIITPRTASDPSYQKTTGTWKVNATGTWFKHLDGTYTANGWEQIQGKWYYFNAAGYLVTNQWMFLDNQWYYVDAEGAMQTGWKLMGEKWYYFDKVNGSMKTGWQYIGDKWYYFGAANDGVMKTGWKMIGSDWYFFDENGAMQTGWEFIGNKWYYFGASNDGAMKIGWQFINGKWYYMSNSASDGSMQTGWQLINGKWYYMDQTGSGAMQTGWKYIGGKWYYMYSSGEMASKTWIGNYYVDASGVWVKTR